MLRLTKWQHNLGRLYDEADALVTTSRVVLGGAKTPCRAAIAIALAADGFEVLDGDSDLAVLRHLRSQRVPHAEPADLVLLDLSRQAERGVGLLSSVRRADWSVPVFVVVGSYPAPTKLHAELNRLSVNGVFAADSEIDDIRTAIVHVAPPSVVVPSSAA